MPSTPSPRSYCKKYLTSFFLITLVIALDFLSKAEVLEYFTHTHFPLYVTPFFNIVLTWNKGMSFGLFNQGNGAAFVLGIFSCSIVAYLGYSLYKTSSSFLSIAYSLVIGGAIGNIIDRFRFKAVVDFLDFHLWGYHWYAFNIADAAIVVGVGLILLDHLRESYKHSKTQK